MSLYIYVLYVLLHWSNVACCHNYGVTLRNIHPFIVILPIST